MNKKNLVLILVSTFILLTGSLLLQGCYRMPSEGECSVIPTTNNPFIYGGNRGNPQFAPKAGF